MARFDDVIRLTAELPGTSVGTSYGTPAVKVGKKLLARLWEDGEALVLLAVEDIEQRFLMETQPEVFFKTPHYDGYDTVLVRLPRIELSQLGELLEQSWERRATKTQLRQRLESRKQAP
jgi:hypothetical protein